MNIIATVVVATRGRAEDVVVAVRSILANSEPDFELIVIDQSDDDSAAALLEPWQDDERLQYVHTSVVGKTKAMNRAVGLARAPYVLFTDDDCEVPSDWVQKMVAALESDEEIGLVFSQLAPGPYDPKAGFVPTYPVTVDGTWDSVWRKTHFGLGATMALRTDVLRSVGGFDEMMGPGSRFPSTDDTEMAVRVLHAGWKVHNTSTTSVVHHGFRTWDQGRDLGRRDFFANGGMCAKSIRSGVWGVIPMIVNDSLVTGFLRPLYRGIQDRTKPRGLKRGIYFWQGFRDGFRVDVDRERVLFKD